MKTRRLINLLVLLALASLLLVACQSPVLEIVNLPGEPTEAAGAVETTAPTEPTELATQAAPTGGGAAQPQAEMPIPEGWQVLDNGRQGYSIVFPPIWKVCQETKYSLTFCEIEDDPAWMGSPLRLYVSVFPNDYTNTDWEVYNFIPTETIRAFMALPVGELMLKEAGSPRPEYVPYVRLPDRVVARRTAPADSIACFP